MVAFELAEQKLNPKWSKEGELYKFTLKESEGKGEKLVWDCQGFCSSVRERPVNEQRNKQSITLVVCSLCCLFPH